MSVSYHDWYEERIEAGVRDIVRLLRDNGVNTVSACHHDMTIQCDYIMDGQLQDIHNLLYCHLSSKGEPVSYDLTIHHQVDNGYVINTFIEIALKRKKVEKAP